MPTSYSNNKIGRYVVAFVLFASLFVCSSVEALETKDLLTRIYGNAPTPSKARVIETQEAAFPSFLGPKKTCGEGAINFRIFDEETVLNKCDKKPILIDINDAPTWDVS